MRSTTGQIISRSFLILALLLFITFHLIRFSGTEYGWHIWLEIVDMVKRPNEFTEPSAALMFAAFLTTSLLIPASPFLGPVWIKSRLAWFVVLLLSGVVAISFLLFAFFIISIDGAERLNAGLLAFIAAPCFNFTGILLARLGAPRQTLP